ncbi:MAG: phytanoyl-CoA dioxygenase family protein [Alphaproteobacteria bacterium]|nr:phytanoyl-CoA dioxygenase family protein [Alphaproteobacteria bacterium]
MLRLTEAQKAFYEREGYLLLPGYLSREWIVRLTEAMKRFIAESRTLSSSSASILVEPGHTLEAPRLRRIPQTVAFDPDFEAFGLRGPVVDIAEDVLGSDVRFHHSKLNFKWSGGGEEIRWHQDIQFWPHSNYSPLTIGVYLTDVDDEMGPMGVVRGSHRGPLYSLRDEAGAWTGALSDDEVRAIDPSSVAWLKGPIGSVTIHNCRAVHGSMANRSPRTRPLLLHTYAAADAIPLTRIMDGVAHANAMVRGSPATHARFGDVPCPMPPAWEKGQYSSIFASQKRETAGAMDS